MLSLDEVDRGRARNAACSVGLALHTTEGDWSRQFVAGIARTLGGHAVEIVALIDCGFDAAKQVAGLEYLIAQRSDTLISLPVADLAGAEAHRRVPIAGIRLT